MNVFLSWSGSLSQQLAHVLFDWLPLVINAADPWMSTESIGKGKRWSAELNQTMDQVKFGIVCVTRENIHADWLIFEAGALAKRLEDCCCPYLLNLKTTDLPEGPLSQLQMTVANKEDTWRLVKTLNKALENPIRTETALLKSFERWWPELNSALEKLIKADASKVDSQPDAQIARTVENMVEEILDIVRDLSRQTSALASSSDSNQDLRTLLLEAASSEWSPKTLADLLSPRNTDPLRSLLLVNRFQNNLREKKNKGKTEEDSRG